MCGRVSLSATPEVIRTRFGLSDFYPSPNLRPSWNIAPTQDMVCIVLDKEGRRKAVKMHWGLIPAWAAAPRMEYPTFNAKSETVREKATFRDAWKGGRRCLIVTNGFYEWRASDKQPFAISAVEGDLTVVAGLWDEWVSADGEVIPSCTILTCAANELIAPLHGRMPVILADSDWPAWLGEVPATEAELLALLRPFPGGKMKLWPVDKRVGDVRNDDPGLVREAPIPPAKPVQSELF